MTKPLPALTILPLIAVGLLVPGARAGEPVSGDLLQVCHLALQNDPALRSAQYLPEIARQNRRRALAATLPQIGLSWQYGLTDTDQPSRPGADGSATPAREYSYRSENYNINVNQVLFDYRAFVSFPEIKYRQLVAEKQFENSRAQTILRAIDYYFRQLVAAADMRLARAELDALSVQLTAARLRLELGADSKISVQQIQARYDQAKARTITTENDYLNARNQLWAVTLKHHDHLASAQEKPPAHEYEPAQIEHWVRLAFNHNPEVSEAMANTRQSHYQRKRVNANYWPRINLNYQYGRQNISGTDQFEALFSEGANSRVSVRVDFPLFTGGGNIAQSRIAAYQYQSSREGEQLVRRRIENEVVQLWNNHRALRAALDAREAALISTTTSLELVRQGKELGSNSTGDVLKSVSDYYQARRDFVSAIYNYLFNQARFEASVGSLGTDTIMRINSYLRP